MSFLKLVNILRVSLSNLFAWASLFFYFCAVFLSYQVPLWACGIFGFLCWFFLFLDFCLLYYKSVLKVIKYVFSKAREYFGRDTL